MNRDSEFIVALNAILEDNYHRENFGVQLLASELSISRSQLHRKIKKETGKSAGAYINEFRLNKATPLLLEGKHNISEVSYKVGFHSPSYFSTAFKKYFSYPPVQFKVRNPKVVYSGKFQKIEETLTQDMNPTKNRSNTFNVLLRNWILLITSLCVVLIVIVMITPDIEKRNQVLNQVSEKQKSIALLPIKDFSQDHSLEGFCHGLTDELISRFSENYHTYRVISQTSSFKFIDANLNLQEIASRLEVDFVLEGNIQKTEKRFKVNLQLIDANMDNHVWTDSYEGTWNPDEIFRIQNNISSCVTLSLKSVLIPIEKGILNQN